MTGDNANNRMESYVLLSLEAAGASIVFGYSKYGHQDIMRIEFLLLDVLFDG